MTKDTKKETRKYTPTRVMLPTNVDHDYSFSLRYIKEAQAAGVEFGTIKFLIYDKHRWFEDCGKIKSGINVAGYKKMGSYYGFSEETVRHAYTELQKDGLMRLVATDGDEKIFRNKTKVWVSTARLTNMRCAAEFVELVTYRGRGHTKPVKCLTGEMVEKSNQNDLKSNQNDLKSNQNDFPSEKPPLSEVPIEVLTISKDIEGKTLVSENEVTKKSKVDKRNPDIQKCMEVWEKAFGKKPTTKPTLGRFACKRLIDKYGVERVLLALPYAAKARGVEYAPQIDNFKDLEDKWDKVERWINKQSPKQENGVSHQPIQSATLRLATSAAIPLTDIGPEECKWLDLYKKMVGNDMTYTSASRQALKRLLEANKSDSVRGVFHMISRRPDKWGKYATFEYIEQWLSTGKFPYGIDDRTDEQIQQDEELIRQGKRPIFMPDWMRREQE